MKTTKLISLAMTALICAGTLASCGIKIDEGTKKEENSTTVEYSAQAPVTFGEYRYYAMGNKAYFDNGDDSYWTSENEESFKNALVEQFKQFVGIKLLANSEKYNMTIGEEDYARIDEIIADYKAQFGEDGFYSVLDESFVNEEIFRHMLEYDMYTEKLLSANAPMEEIMKYAEENYVRVQHVLISFETEDETAQADAENEVEASEADETVSKLEAKTLADEITKRARDGEDFYSLVEQYGEDPGMVNNPEGYFFTYGAMVEEFEKASFELEVGEISDPVETPYGYHIIKKLPLDLEPESDDYYNIVYEVAGGALTEEITAFTANIDIEYTDAFNALTMLNIGTPKETTEEGEETVSGLNSYDWKYDTNEVMFLVKLRK